jgi:hypothetical protein
MLVLTCAVLLACTQEVTRREILVEQQVVEDRLNSWVRLMNNAKLDSLMLFYDQVPELQVLWSDGQRTGGWEETEQGIRDFFGGLQWMNFVVSEIEVEVLSQRAATTTFRHSTDIIRRDGQRLPVSSGQGTQVWLKDQDDDLWKIHTSHVSVSQPSMN